MREKTNPSSLGYMHIKIYLRLHNITEEKENELLKELNQQKGIYWLSSLRGKYDIVASIYVKNIADFSERYESIFGKWGDYILERNIIVLEEAYTYTKAYLLPDKESEEIVYSKQKLRIMDHKDVKIIFQYGKYLIAAIIVDEALDIYKTKLKKLIDYLESLYETYLPTWDGDLTQFQIIKPIIKRYFTL